jgi:hypothetical protein
VRCTRPGEWRIPHAQSCRRLHIARACNVCNGLARASSIFLVQDAEQLREWVESAIERLISCANRWNERGQASQNRRIRWKIPPGAAWRDLISLPKPFRVPGNHIAEAGHRTIPWGHTEAIMRKLGMLFVVIAAALAAGCWTLSINPLYFEEDLILEPSLVGIWGDPKGDDSGTWTFEEAEEKTYRLVTQESDSPDAAFEAHLLMLGGNLCLDLYPEEQEYGNEFQLAHLIPAHSFWRVSLDGDDLTLDCVDTEWLEAKIDSGIVTLDHIRPENMIVLSASTEDLQAFVLQYMDEAMTGDPLVLKRIR